MSKHIPFRANPQMEGLRRLRDSAHSNEREKAENLLRGSKRAALGHYEEDLRQHLRDGGQLPEGVAPLEQPTDGLVSGKRP